MLSRRNGQDDPR
jgi:hypothetical protein